MLADNVLVAVLVLLSNGYELEAGQWFLETGYGRLGSLRHPTFAGLAEAQAWIAEQLEEW